MRKNNPLKVGITGGIGAGKTIVARVFQTLKIPVYDADSRAKWLMSNDSTLMESITALFGKNAYIDGELNRALLARTAFETPDKLAALNKLVHPAVAIDFERWSREQTAPYLLKEAALLIETGSYKSLDYLITVSAPEKLRVSRTLKRDPQRSEQDIKKILANQLPEEAKSKLSDFVITNDDHQMVIPQVLKIHQALLRKIGG